MDFSGNICDHAIVGRRVAAAFAAVRGADCVPVVTKRVSRLRKCCRPDRVRGFRFQFVKPATRNARPFRHAASARHFFDRAFDLGKNQDRRTMANARPMADVWFADGGNVDQRPDRLRVLASGHHRDAIVPRPARPPLHWVVRLVALVRVARNISNLGRRGLALGPALLRTGHRPRISRAFWRSWDARAPLAIVLFLSAASVAQIFSVERSADWTCDCRSSRATLEPSRDLQRNVASNSLADLLEHRRADLDVVDSFKARRPNFSNYSAALFA